MRRRSRRVAALALCWTALAAPVPAGIADAWDAEGLAFEAGLASWEHEGDAFSATLVDGRTAVRCALAVEGTARLARAWTPADLGAALPWPGDAGRRPSAELALRIEAPATNGTLALRVVAEEPGGDRVLAESTLALAAAPRGRWFRFSTGVAVEGLSSDTARVRWELEFEGHGELLVDDGRLGGEVAARCADASGAFEQGADGFTTDAASQTGSIDATLGGYRGAGCARLVGDGAWLERVVAIDADCALVAPHAVEAGAWVRAAEDTPLPNVPNAHDEVRLTVVARDGAGTESLLAEGRWRPFGQDGGQWLYLEAQPVADATIPPGAVELVVRADSTLAGEVRVDEVALGETDAVDGNPRRVALCNYVGRYRSPLWNQGAGPLADPQENWRNWRWTAPPAPDGAFDGFAHDPDCSSSASCFRSNGRRDLAVGTERGADVLPLVGAYDSRDPRVLEYHVELAEALGLDVFVYDWLGHELAQQDAQWGREPLNEQCLEALLDVLDGAERTLKVAPMFEPKVHMLGWVGGQPSLLDKKLGIAADLGHWAQVYGGRRGVLRRDGRLVVFLFRDRSCDPSGVQCLDANDWTDVVQWVEASTGERLLLVADARPVDGAPFEGMSRWDLVSRDLLRYRTFADAAAGAPTVPAPTLDDLRQHCADRHGLGDGWRRGDPRRRLHVPIVWPGFDDTGVAGWGMQNLLGEDGLPLGVRVAEDPGGRFYRTTVASARASGADWIQIVTWNDWNEGTQIEPSFDPRFAASPFAAWLLDARVRRNAFGRALETQAWIADFKGTEADTGRVPRIAMRYLVEAAWDPGVSEYD